jgi:hypothetical protein
MGGADETGSQAGAAAENVYCPSLQPAPEDLLFAWQDERERALVRADGSVHLRHTVNVDIATEAFLEDGAELVFAAVEYGIDSGERAFEIARFDAAGELSESTSGVLPEATDLSARLYPPEFRLEDGAIAFDQANGDSWLVDFAGNLALRECARHTPLGAAEEAGWIGARVNLRYSESQAVFVDTASGACKRLSNLQSTAGATTFRHGRFQYLRADALTPVFTDEGPSTSEDFPLSPRENGNHYTTLYPLSDDVLYVLAAPELARYDLATREFRMIPLPSSAASFGTHGEHIVGYAAGLPLFTFDASSETVLEFELELELELDPYAVRLRSSDHFLLLAIDERPTTWLDLSTGESRPFEVAIPQAAELQVIELAPFGLLVADGVPFARFDLEAGSAAPVDLERSGGAARTFARDAHAVVEFDGVPAFRVDLESGSVDPVRDNAGIGGEASTELQGPHVVVSSSGRPRALLAADSRELLALADPDGVAAAATLLANERYIVGFDERNWPVFRLDTSDRTLAAFAVSGPNDLAGFTDERYVEVPGDTLYEQYYAPARPHAAILEDGSVAVALRDARQGGLWVAAPSDTVFRLIGRPVAGGIALSWSTSEYSFEIAGDRGSCYCQPPVVRWEDGADPDALGVDSVQLVSRVHPELVLVRPYVLDPTGVCVAQPMSGETLVHDLAAGTSRSLENPTGAVDFVTPVDAGAGG